MTQENLLTETVILLPAKEAYNESLKNHHIQTFKEFKEIRNKIGLRILEGYFEACFSSLSKDNQELLENLGYKIKTMQGGFCVSWEFK